MAESLFSASLLDEFERDHKHWSDISETVLDLSRRLKSEEIPFALVGGLSLRHYGFVRHTENIDILTTPNGLELIHKKVVGLGYALRAAGLRKSLRNTRFKVNVDFIQSGEHAGSASSPYVYPDPRSDAFVDDPSGLRIPKLSTLLVIKLVSGLWGPTPQRPRRCSRAHQGEQARREFFDRAHPRGPRKVSRAPRNEPRRGRPRDWPLLKRTLRPGSHFFRSPISGANFQGPVSGVFSTLSALEFGACW